jgi:hypothetical protein
MAGAIFNSSYGSVFTFFFQWESLFFKFIPSLSDSRYQVEGTLKGLSHEMDFAFDDIYGFC